MLCSQVIPDTKEDFPAIRDICLLIGSSFLVLRVAMHLQKMNAFFFFFVIALPLIHGESWVILS